MEERRESRGRAKSHGCGALGRLSLAVIAIPEPAAANTSVSQPQRSDTRLPSAQSAYGILYVLFFFFLIPHKAIILVAAFDLDMDSTA